MGTDGSVEYDSAACAFTIAWSASLMPPATVSISAPGTYEGDSIGDLSGTNP